jgi:hypothetical protein
MTDLTALREDLAAVLAAAIDGAQVLAHDVDRPSPPQIILTPSSPWIELDPAAPAFARAHRLAVRILCVTHKAKAVDQIRALEDLTSAVLTVLGGTDWTPTEISQPYYLTGDTFQLPAVTITATTPINLTN